MAFFGCRYYAGIRPAEVVALRAGDCELPASGWGPLQLARSEPWAGQEWTDNGEVANAARSNDEPPTPSGPCRSPPSWSACSAPTWRPSEPGTAERCSATNAAASLWLNSGVPATEVARRLGQDVAVLLKIYANCINGQEGEINDRITAALTAHHDHETLPPAPAVDTAAQTKPRTRARTVGSGPRKTAGQPS